jgi:hypothetical protein
MEVEVVRRRYLRFAACRGICTNDFIDVIGTAPKISTPSLSQPNSSDKTFYGS